jgi:hypothetical protein
MGTMHRILFLPGFTSRSGDDKASDAVGYGITVADAIVAELPKYGISVESIVPDIPVNQGNIEQQRLAWIVNGYLSVINTPPESYDAVFIFHAFQHFP